MKEETKYLGGLYSQEIADLGVVVCENSFTVVYLRQYKQNERSVLMESEKLVVPEFSDEDKAEYIKLRKKFEASSWVYERTVGATWGGNVTAYGYMLWPAINAMSSYMSADSASSSSIGFDPVTLTFASSTTRYVSTVISPYPWQTASGTLNKLV